MGRQIGSCKCGLGEYTYSNLENKGEFDGTSQS
jgi:hypothetical protein